MKKYIVIGGGIESKTDRNIHYINAGRLCTLYQLNPAECYLVEEKDYYEKERYSLPKNLPRLYPRYDGNYTFKKG